MKIEDYSIMYNVHKAEPTGVYEITKRGTRKAILKYYKTYQTKAGEFKPEEWRKKLRQIIEEDNKLDLLEKIKAYCRQNYVWIKTEQDLDDYSIDCLVTQSYKHWKDFK